MKVLTYLIHNVSRIIHPLRGLKQATLTNNSFQFQLGLMAVVLLLVYIFLSPLHYLEWLLVLIGVAMMLITELQNSSIETALDHLHPELHDQIGHSKDVAAAAVLLAGLFLTTVIAVLAFNHFL